MVMLESEWAMERPVGILPSIGRRGADKKLNVPMREYFISFFSLFTYIFPHKLNWLVRCSEENEACN